jgi:hypothetical protein
MRFLWLNLKGSILLSRSLVQGIFRSCCCRKFCCIYLLCLTIVVILIVLKRFLIVSIKLSSITHISIASPNKLWSIVLSELLTCSLWLAKLIYFDFEVNMTLKTTILNLITYLWWHVTLIASLGSECHRDLTYSIRRINNHCFCSFFIWGSKIIGISRPICVSSNI